MPDPAPAPTPAEPLLAVPDGKRVAIGITGEPGAGKSALARQLAALGGRMIIVDEVGHGLLEVPQIKRELVTAFGADILSGDGGVDRRALAARAFASADQVARLNAIMHPRLAARVRLMAQKAGRFAVIDASLLHELGLGDLCTISIYVKAHRDARVQRVTERGWDEAELARREAALGNVDERRKKCQLAVDNSGDPALLAAYAKTILARQLGVDLGALKKQQAEAARMAGEQPDDSADADEPTPGDGADEPAGEPAPAPAQGGGFQQQPRQGGDRDRDQRQGGNQQPRQGGDRDRDRQGGDRDQRQGGNQQPRQGGEPERPPVKVMLDDYLKRTLPDLQGEADKLEVRDVKWLKKHDLISEILRRVASGRADEIIVSGFMEIAKEQGYIRSPLNNYLAVATDTFCPIQMLRRWGLKPGMHVSGVARAPRGNEKCPQLLAIHTVMGEPENKRTPVQDFESLTPLHAYERLFMELPNDPSDLSLRVFDVACPIGKGQRGLIVAQPKCGKTVYLQKIAKAITTNNPEVELMVLLVDERPEEVTDMQRSVKGEVIASTFDQPASRHVQCAEVTINKAKRLVERGRDVVILLDSITRLARAYNTEAPGSGRVMSGGIESGALIKPKQFFGAARKIEGGGSLTILATALVDTGSLADTVIFEEFKGTGNMELVLDRRLADRRIFPAINIPASGTRKDDLLIKSKDELVRVWALRKFLAERSPQDAVEFLKGKLSKYRTNVEFLLTIDPEKTSMW
ncbi:MAG: transcription termination factor Rho [Planctomycetes bacterium]|nr:transcription termination factor Rho [Planctomycetota bacterium]